MVNMNLMMIDLIHQLVVEAHVVVNKNHEEQFEMKFEEQVTKRVVLKE